MDHSLEEEVPQIQHHKFLGFIFCVGKVFFFQNESSDRPGTP